MVFLAEFLPAAHVHVFGQEGGAVAHALEAAHFQALGLPQAAHLAVATFHQDHVVPAVAAFATGFLDVGKMGHAVFQFHTFTQALQLFRGDLAVDAAGVLAVDAVGRVHHRVGQFTVAGQQKQAGGVDIQAANGNPALVLQFRQIVENGGSAFRVGTGGDLAFRLVVDQGAETHRLFNYPPFLVIHLDDVAGPGLVAQARRFAIQAQFARCNALFQATPGTNPGGGQDLLDALLAGGNNWLGGFRIHAPRDSAGSSISSESSDSSSASPSASVSSSASLVASLSLSASA